MVCTFLIKLGETDEKKDKTLRVRLLQYLQVCLKILVYLGQWEKCRAICRMICTPQGPQPGCWKISSHVLCEFVMYDLVAVIFNLLKLHRLFMPIVMNLFRWIPESARWLLGRGKNEEAKTIICKVAAINKKNIPDNLLMEMNQVNFQYIVQLYSVFSTYK